MDQEKESIIFDANLDSLSPIREYLTSLGESVGLDKNKTYKLCLAVDEIATNIINYGYGKAGVADGKIDVTAFTENGKLFVFLEDKATPFNPLEHKTPGQEDMNIPLEERPIGGLGIMLAKESVDLYDYKFLNGINRNIFCVNLKNN